RLDALDTGHDVSQVRSNLSEIVFGGAFHPCQHGRQTAPVELHRGNLDFHDSRLHHLAGIEPKVRGTRKLPDPVAIEHGVHVVPASGVYWRDLATERSARANRHLEG